MTRVLFGLVIIVSCLCQVIVGLGKDGANVCSDVKVVKQKRKIQFFRFKDVEYETCCKSAIFCLKKCRKKGKVQYTLSKMVDVPMLVSNYRCCKGWTKSHVTAQGCEKPICEGGCKVGKCVKPNQCSYEYDSSKGPSGDIDEIRCMSHQEPICSGNCEKVFNSSTGLIALTGRQYRGRTKICIYEINRQSSYEAIRFVFEKFQFNTNLTCARSSVTLIEEQTSKGLYCSLSPPPSSIVMRSSRVYVEVVVSNWQEDDGIVIRFSSLKRF